MSSTPSLPPGDAAGQAATAKAFLEEIGLRDVFEQGVKRLLEVCPRPSSLLEALRVLSAQMTRDIEALEGGESKSAAAAETTEALSMIVDTVVRVEAILHTREVGRPLTNRACYFRTCHPSRPTPKSPSPCDLPVRVYTCTIPPPSRPLPRARAPPPPHTYFRLALPPHAPTSSFSRPHTLCESHNL
jgi:hypothetical protein